MTTFIEGQQPQLIPQEPDSKPTRPKTTLLSIVLNRKNQLTLFVWLFALVVPVLIYYFLFHRQITLTDDYRTCSVNSTFRVPCGVVNTTRVACLSHYCCFDDVSETCFHAIPSFYAYKMSENDEYLPLVQATPFKTPTTQHLSLSVTQNERSVRITLSEVEESSNGFHYENDNLSVTTCNGTYLGVDIKHNETLLMTTCLGPLIVSENYLEWTFYLGHELFGFDRLHFSGNETVRKVFYHNADDHSTLPVFMGYQNNSFSGLSIEYGGPMEVMVLPSRLIVVRAIGHQNITVVFHNGPTPKDVTQQLYNFEFEPPRWILEPHICRRGSQNLTAAIMDYKEFNSNVNVSFASDCFHENLYFMLFTATANEIEELKEAIIPNSRFIFPVFPYIPVPSINETNNLYNSSVGNNILYLKSENCSDIQNVTNVGVDVATNCSNIQNGSYVEQEVVYPDFQSIGIKVWMEELMNFIDIGLSIDGYTFNSNFASDDSFKMSNVTKGLSYFGQQFADAMSNTLQWNATSPDALNNTEVNCTQHMYCHNDYGEHQLNAFTQVNTYPAILFSSVYPKHSNVIAQVENMNGTWANLKKTLQIVLTHSLLAHPMVSVPICGSTSFLNVAEQSDLCMRWYIMAATMPFFKISSDLPLRDPDNLGNGQATNAALNAIGRRKLLSHYYYTLLMGKEPITRPMFYDFYQNTTTFDLDEQYMVGDGLLVAQVFLKDQPTVSVYLPHEADCFYEFFGGRIYEELGWITLSAVPTDWFVFIRGGRIIPLFYEDHYSLAIALPQNETEATGSLFLKTTSLYFSANNEGVTFSKVLNATQDLNCCDENADPPCDATQKDLPVTFANFSVYGLEDSFTTINVELNLCSEKEADAILCTFGDGICKPWTKEGGADLDAFLQ